MRRRTLLGGLAGLATLGGGAWYLTQGTESTIVEPVELDPVWTPDETQQLTVPETGRVTVVEFFATWCDICEGKMPTLRQLYEGIDPDEVQFVSLTIEPLGATVTAEDVQAWFASNEGRWPVAGDEGLHFTRELGVINIPRTVVFDPGNRIVYDEVGDRPASVYREAIDEARS